MNAWVRLTARQKMALDEALDPHGLTPVIVLMLEAHLTSYRERHRALTAAERRGRVIAGRRLVALMARTYREDDEDEDDRLLVDLAARLQQWEQDATARPRPPHRPADNARLVLLERAVGVLDDAGLPWRRSWHRDGPRVRALRVVLQIADALDGRPASKGSLRLITQLQRRMASRGVYRTTPRSLTSVT